MAFIPRAAVIIVFSVAMMLGIGIWLWQSTRQVATPGLVNKVVVLRPPPPKYPVTVVHDASLAPFPYAPGWPLHLPGEIVATPVVADLLGDGHLEIVAPCMANGDLARHITAGEPLLYAFRLDGSVLTGWPVDLEKMLPDAPRPTHDQWGSSPSLFPGGGKHNLVLMAPHAGLVVVRGDGSVTRLGGGSNWRDTVPLADLDGDGTLDIAIGKYIANIYGKPVNGWPPERQFADGYTPCIGDAFGDGKLRLFHLFYSPENSDMASVGGFDCQGNPLPGWPHAVQNPSVFAPVMGDVLGNGQMQIIAAYGGKVLAWNPDGSPLPHTTTDGPITGILKSNVDADAASPALADLDGDGKAEIILFDHQTQSLRAWHGDGSGVTGPPDAIGIGDELKITTPDLWPGRDSERNTTVDDNGNIEPLLITQFRAWGFTPHDLERALAEQYRSSGINKDAKVSVTIMYRSPSSQASGSAGSVEVGRNAAGDSQSADNQFDGLIARLPTDQVAGVTVVSLGDDPKVMDFFAGTYWIRRFPDGKATITNMLPDDPEMDQVQPTVVDLEGNGKADVIFGTADGRLCVYQTGLACQAQRMQWPTCNGNFHHTGAWRKPQAPAK